MKLQKKQQALLVLPFFIIAFSALGFYAFQPKTQAAKVSPGLNTTLPEAAFDKHEKPKDKMSFYAQAKLDSDKAQSNNNSPFLQQLGFKSKSNTAPASANPTVTVTQINQKLAEINRQISQPQPTLPKPATDQTMNKQVDKLEAMMKTMNNNQGPDPQMQQLTKMLEQIQQIQQIQHPEKTVPKPDSAANPFRAVRATIDGKQKVRQAGAVRLKLMDSITVKGQVIPKGTAVYGTANITNQRLLIAIKNIRLGQSIIPVDLAVYYTDGMPGVPAPEAEFGEAAAGGADNALQSMEFLSMDQSLATQAAAGGISAAKTLFSKKVKRIVVHLKDGDAVLLRNNGNSK